MEAMIVEVSRVEARCWCVTKVCTSQGCARAREDLYRADYIIRTQEERYR